MLSPRKRTGGSRVGLALFAAALLVVVGTPSSSARAAEDDEAPKAAAPEPTQADDSDWPKDKSLLAPNPADAAVAKKNQDEDVPMYQKWQFWAVAGGIVVGLVALGFGGHALYHSLNGGDVRPCNPSFIACFGQGE